VTRSRRLASLLLASGVVLVAAGFLLMLHNPVIHDSRGDRAQCLAPYDVVINGAEREMPAGPFTEAKNQRLCRHAGVTHFWSGAFLGVAGALCLGTVGVRRRTSTREPTR
jgi:hypothetical protein